MPEDNNTFSWPGFFVFAGGVVWIGFHVNFCCGLLDFEKQWRFEEFKDDLSWLLLVNVFALFYVLLAPGKENLAAERRFSLVGAFILGITPLGLAGLAFITTLPYFEQSLKNDTNEVDLRKYHSVVQSDIKIWLGLDISKSVLRKDGAVASGLCGLTAKLLGAEDGGSWSGKDPLVWNGISGMKLNSKATVKAFLYEFAAETSGSISLGVSNFTDPWPRTLSGNVCDRMKALSVKGSDTLTVATDIVKFFEAMEPSASEALQEGHRVVILTVSDFLHDLPDAESSGVEKRLRSVAQKLREAQSQGRDKCEKSNGVERKIPCSQLAIVGLLVPRSQKKISQDSGRWTEPIDALPLLAAQFQDAWYSFDFREMSTVGSPDDQLILRGLLATEVEVKVDETLFLRAYSGEQGKQFTLIRNILAPSHRSSGDVNSIAFKLKPWPDRGSLPDELNISVETVPEGQEFPKESTSDAQTMNSSAKTSDARWTYFDTKPREDTQARLALQSHLDIGKVGRISLLLAVPGNLVVYRIPVVIVPYAGKGARDIFVLAVYLLIACVVVPCVAHFGAWCWKNRAALKEWLLTLLKKLWPLAILHRAGLRLLAVSWIITEYLEGKFGKKGGHEAD